MATLYVGLYKTPAPDYRLMKSVNSGVTWTGQWTDAANFWPRGIVTYPNDNVIVLLGSSGTDQGMVYRSTNGGVSFGLLYNVTSAYIDDAQKSRETEDVIFACGKIGRFWKSTDKGLTFTYGQIAGYTTTWFRSVSFIDDDIGFVCGGQYILKTIDGGANWTQKYSVAGKVLMGIFAVDANTIWALPEAAADHVLKSTDGGDTWNMITTTKSGLGKRIAGLAADDQHLWFVSRTGGGLAEVTYTSNGGTNWASVNATADNISYGRRTPIVFVDANVGYLFALDCWKSSDGGQTWSNIGMIDTSWWPLSGMAEMDFAVEWRSFNVAGTAPTDRTTEGSAISAANPLNFGSVGPGNDSLVKCLIWRAVGMGIYTTISDMCAWLQSKVLVGTNFYYLDITNTWTQNKTPVQVAAGTPGVCPQTLPGAANLTKIGGGNITGVGHADTSQYVYVCFAVGGDEVSGVDIALNYRVNADKA